MGYYPNELKANKDAANESSFCFVRYDIQIYRSHNMLYHGAQRVKLPNLSKISRLLSPPSHIPEISSFPTVYDK